MLLDLFCYRIPRILLLLLLPGFLITASGQVAFTLASGAGSPGSTVSLNISLNSSGAQPAAMQWTLSYSAAQISSIAVTAGPAATNAGKTVSCNQAAPGSMTCVLFGLNQSTVANGVVAVAAVTIANTTSTSTVISMSNGVASTGSGSPLVAAAVGNTVTINQPVVSTTTITISANPPGLQIIVDGSALTAPQTFQWTAGSQHTISTNSPQGSGSTRYVFSSWSDGGAQSHTITTPSSPTTYTASFTTQFLLTTAVSPAASGTVQANPSSADGYYNSGSIVQLTATPFSGFQFSSWTGGMTSATALTTVGMNAPLSATANFSTASSCSYTLSRTTFAASSEGDFGRIQLSTGETCNWNASSNSQWLSISSGSSGTGGDFIGFLVAANPGATMRVGSLTIGNQIFTVTQASSACGSNVGITNAVLDPLLAGAGSLSLNISAPASCQWSASVPPGWVTITSGSSGTGSGIVQVSIATNQNSNPRMASLQVGGSAIPLIQLGTTTPQFYSDVPPSYLFVQNINLLVLNGILSGCTPTAFCPEVNATRAEAAPLIIRALFGDNFSYSPTPYFTDVSANHQFFKYIQKMRELEITVGCTTTEYCPDGLVTRGQMAAFLIRAKLGGAGIPVVGGSSISQSVYPLTPYFQDVPVSYIFFPFIQKIKQLGITFGCSTTQYCPENLTTRGQLAAFLTRGFLAP